MRASAFSIPINNRGLLNNFWKMLNGIVLFSLDFGISWPFWMNRHCFIISSIYFFSVRILFSLKNLNTLPSEASYLPSISIVRQVSLMNSMYWLSANLLGRWGISLVYTYVGWVYKAVFLLRLIDFFADFNSKVGDSFTGFAVNQLENPCGGLVYPLSLTYFFSAGDPSVEAGKGDCLLTRFGDSLIAGACFRLNVDFYLILTVYWFYIAAFFASTLASRNLLICFFR